MIPVVTHTSDAEYLHKQTMRGMILHLIGVNSLCPATALTTSCCFYGTRHNNIQLVTEQQQKRKLQKAITPEQHKMAQRCSDQQQEDSRIPCTSTNSKEECLKRIEALNPILKAWVHVIDSKKKEETYSAEQVNDLSTHAIQGKSRQRPLEGIPIGIKDIIDVQDIPTLAGCSEIESFNNMPKNHATVVHLLKQNGGCIILGKTTTTQYAHLDPSDAINYVNHNYTPGGSSSGSAVAVSSGMCPIAIGTQTGGSILRPSSYCNIVGFKPSHGTIDMTGILPVSSHFDCVGPMAKSVNDIEMVWNVMVGNNEKERQQSKAYEFEYYLLEPFMELCSDDVKEVTQQALDIIFSNNTACELHKISSLPFILKKDILEPFLTIASYDAYHYHQNRGILSDEKKQYLKPKFLELMNQGKETTYEQYQSALAQQHSIRQRAHEQLFGIIDTSKSSATTSHCNKESTTEPNDTTIKICILPTTPTTAPLLSKHTTGDASFNVPWSVIGGPAITIPIGFSTRTQLPCGLQLVSAIGTDHTLLQAAKFCEQCLYAYINT